MFIRLLLSVVLAAFVSGPEAAVLAGAAPSASAPTVASHGGAVARPVVLGSSSPTAPQVDQRTVVVPPVAPSGQVQPSNGPTPPGALVASEAAQHGRVQSAVLETHGFQTVGVTWPAGADVSRLEAEVRTRSAGVWSDWQPLTVGDVQPDAGSPDARRERGGTDPLWVGQADAVQVSFAATPQGGPTDLRLSLVSSATPQGTSAGTGVANAQPAVAHSGSGVVLAAAAARPAALQTSVAAPRLITREQWGALPEACTPAVASTLVAAVVHHTADSNDYSTVAEAEQQIRNDQAYHIYSRGWCDIGYNFIVDKWGNIYEGRANSLTEPVIGVHAGGFNTDTVGIAMLGDYSTITPSPATQASVAQIAAYRLAAYHHDPGGSVSYTTWGGETDRWTAGTTVTIPRVMGHRDVDLTACPGDGGYSVLGSIRAQAQALARPSFLEPTISATTGPAKSPYTIRSQTLSDINWHLVVTDDRTGVMVAQTGGYAQQSQGGVVVTWNGDNTTFAAVGPGPYRLTLTGTDAATGSDAVPYSTVVQITGSENPPTVSPVPLVGELQFVPITPTRVLDTRPAAQSIGPASRVDVTVAGVGGVPADAKAVAVNITAVASSDITYIRAWPAGQPAPATSVLNSDPGRSASAAGVVLGVGGQGKISLYNNAGSTHLLVDVTGYYSATGGAPYGAMSTAWRAMDSRTAGAPLSNGARQTLTLAGQAGVPSDATAVVVNVTSVHPLGAGYVAVVPSGSGDPGVSTVNDAPGADVANRAIVPLAGGKVDVLVAGATTDVVVDVVGWFGPSGSARFTPIAPVRIADTRTSGGALSAGTTRSFALGAAVPSDAAASLVSLTATDSTAPATYLTAWPAAGARPATSDLNVVQARDQANATVVGADSSRAIDVYNNLGSVDVVLDVYGFFR